MSVIQGTPVEGYQGQAYTVSVDTGANGNPSPKGSDVTAKIELVGEIPPGFLSHQHVFTVTYGSAVSGSPTVTMPQGSTGVSWTVHTNGTGTDASVSIPASRLPAHIDGPTVVWGS